jgi:hypothetical protein
MQYLSLSILFLGSLHKHGNVSFAIFILMVSISPLIKYLTGLQSLSIFYAFFLVGILIAAIIRDRGQLNNTMILYGLGVICIMLIQQAITDFDLNFLALGLVKLLMLPLLGYFTAKYLHSNNKDLFSVFSLYLIVNLAIFYCRAFFEYTFFGILDVRTEEWVYRPSNLSSPIIFAVEMAIIISIMHVSNVSKRTKIIFIALIFIPLILMQTRAAIALFALMTMTYLIYSKQFLSLFALTIFGIFIVYLLWFITGETPYIFSIFSYEGGAYGSRLSSITQTLTTFSEFNILEMLFGIGSGLASQHASSFGYESIYVENGIITLLVENGFLTLILFLMSLIYYVLKASLAGIAGYLYLLLLLIVGINFFSASLTTISIQALFWLIYFYGLFFSNKDRHILDVNFKKRGMNNYEL